MTTRLKKYFLLSTVLFIGIIALFGITLAAPFAYIPNGGSNDVSVIDISTNTVISTITVGTEPRGVVVNPGGTMVYVTNWRSHNVSVIAAAPLNTVTATIAVGSAPCGIAINHTGTRVYVANSWSNDLSVIETITNTLITTVPTGNFPFGVAVNREGSKVYVTNFRSNNVSVIDTSTHTVIATVSVGNGPQCIGLNTAGTRLYVANSQSNSVSVIDTSNNTLVATILVGFGPSGVAVNPAGTRVYVTNFNSSTLSAIDALTNTEITNVTVGSRPAGVAVNPEGTRVYVVNYNSNNVHVIDTGTNTVVATIGVGSQPEALGQFISPWTVWRGPVSIPLKYTSLVDEPTGDVKFHKSTVTSTGTIELYKIGEVVTQVKFLVSGGELMNIKSIGYIETDVSRSKTKQFLLIGTGDGYIVDEAELTGPAYLDAKGTLKKDSSGEVTSISISGKISGGYSSEVVFSGSFRATLTQ